MSKRVKIMMHGQLEEGFPRFDHKTSFINYSRNISLVQLRVLVVAGSGSFGSGLVGLRIKN